MRTTTVFLFVIWSISCSAQKQLNAKIVLKNSNDTIDAIISVRANGKYQILDERSFLKEIIALVDGNPVTFKGSMVRGLKLNDFQNMERTFISLEEMTLRNNLTNVGRYSYPLVEEMSYGALSWYRSYSSHIKDGSKVTLDYFTLDGQMTFVSILSNKKKKFKELTKKFPQLESQIDKGFATQFDILDLIVRYNLLEEESD